MLQHAVAEASCGRANIETDFALEFDSPVLQSFLQLQPATADVAEILTQHAQRRGGVNRCPGLFDLLLVNQNFSSEDEGLRALTRRRKASLHKQLVETCLHRRSDLREESNTASTRCSA